MNIQTGEGRGESDVKGREKAVGREVEERKGKRKARTGGGEGQREGGGGEGSGVGET